MALGTFKNFGNNQLIDRLDYRMAGNFTDANMIMNLLDGGAASTRTHLGILSLFNQVQLVNTPLMKMTDLAKNTLYVNGDDGEFTFDVPYTLEMPTVKADLTGDNQFVGIDGQTFQLIIGDGNQNSIFSVNEIITADLRDGQNFIVLAVESAASGIGGYKYTLRLVTTDKTEYVDKRAIAPGVQYFSVGSAIGAYDEYFPGVNQSAGFMRLLHKIGNKRGVEMTITGNAQRLKLDGLKGMGGMEASFEAELAPYMNPKNPDFWQAIGHNNGNGKIDYSKPVSVVPMFEVLLYKQLMLQQERALMWGQGGVIPDQRNNYKIVSQGLYQQMKNGNWLKIPKYTKDTIIQVLSQVFKNRPDIADVDRYIKLVGGRGAVNELTRIFTQEGAYIANAIGTVLDNSSVKVITGSPYELEAGYRFTKVFFPGFGHVSIEHNPAFDSEFNRYMDEERIGGLPKYSYTAAMFDVTETNSTNAFKPSKDVTFAKGFDNQANVYMVKNAGMPAVKYTYVNGRTSPYPVSVGKGTLASTRFDGATIIMEEQSSVWLRDPGRSVLITLL